MVAKQSNMICRKEEYINKYLEALPGQTAAVEVHQYVAEGLHIVPATLFYPQVSVDAGVAGCTRQVLVLPVRDVLTCPVVSVLLGQAKVNEEYL